MAESQKIRPQSRIQSSELVLSFPQRGLPNTVVYDPELPRGSDLPEKNLEARKKEDRRVAKTIYTDAQWPGASADFKLSGWQRFYHHSPTALSRQTRHSSPGGDFQIDLLILPEASIAPKNSERIFDPAGGQNHGISENDGREKTHVCRRK